MAEQFDLNTKHQTVLIKRLSLVVQVEFYNLYCLKIEVLAN